MMKLQPGQYLYRPWGSCFRIYRMNEPGGLSPYTMVDDEPVCRCREHARRRVYELNGWKLK